MTSPASETPGNSGGSGRIAWPRRTELAANPKRTLAAVFALLPAFACALGTPAGTPVDNTATVSYDIGGVPGTALSNTDSFLVAELLDTTLANNDAGNVAAFSPDSGIALSFTLTNTGNGSETFALAFDAALGGDQFDPQGVQLYLDDGDGIFNRVVDTLYSPGINDPVLAADASRVVFVVGDMPSALAGGDLGSAQLTANAVTGSGAAGTAFIGAGDGGVDALIACTMTNARKSAQLRLQKTWVSGRLGDEATVSSSGFANNTNTGASVSAGNNTTVSAPVTVYAAESGTISEMFGMGDPAEYVASLSCTGSSGLSGATLTVDPADTAITCTYTNTLKQPSLTLLKSQTVISDPINGVVNPKSIPGTVRSYSIRVTNSGPGAVDSNSLVIKDPLPAGVELYVGDLAGPGLGPVAFVDGATASGLAWTYAALASLADNLDFSNDGGATWNYVPVPDVDGFDAAVTHVRLKPSGAMSAAGVGNPYADFTFRVRVK